MIKFAINGFGRIGRCVLRALAECNIDGLECVVVNGGHDALASHLHLLKYDSSHGIFKDCQQLDEATFRVGRHVIKSISEMDPAKINWADYGVDVVFECTGKFTSAKHAAVHLNGGAKKVLVSAPSDGADITVVMGVNHSQLLPQHRIISIGSCTTNCLAPVASVLHEALGIQSGLMTTIHAYTNDQVLLDANHKDLRRARSAALSMIPSSTGAAKAIGLVIPELNGKLDGASIRVPVANVSIVELMFNAKRDTNVEEINAIMLNASNSSNYKGILGYNDLPLVSVDFNHSPLSAVFDASLTKVMGGKLCKVSAWYDNEWGFSNRMLEVAALLAT